MSKSTRNVVGEIVTEVSKNNVGKLPSINCYVNPDST